MASGHARENRGSTSRRGVGRAGRRSKTDDRGGAYHPGAGSSLDAEWSRNGAAARPSTGDPIPSPDSTEGIQEEDDDESPRRRCQSAELNITGCDREHLSGLPRRGTSLGRYLLLRDNALSKREDARSAFFCAKHGKEYLTIIQNKLRSRASCWQRGSLRGRDGNWALERPRRMQMHFEEPKRKGGGKRGERKGGPAEQLKWGKTPASVEEPSSPSGASPKDTESSKERGMADAAFPLQTRSRGRRGGQKIKQRRRCYHRNRRIEYRDKILVFNVAKDDRLDDISGQMMKEEDERTTNPETKPGILLNAQFGGAAKQFRKMPTSFKTDERHRGNDADDAGNTDEGESPGEELRTKTAKRKNKVRASEIGHSEESWGEIRSHIDRDTRQRSTKNDQERRRTSRRDSLDSTQSSRKSAASHNRLSPRESGTSMRRPTYLFQPSKTRCRNEHSRDSPSSLRQTCPRAADPPLSLKFGTALLPESTKQRDDMDKVADVLLTLQGGKPVT